MTDALSEYRKKRNFALTPEPQGTTHNISNKTHKPRFVIQEHWASHHHFDFRLETKGILESWAVPKGIPEKVGIKRLAIHTENHPLEYLNFEGIIPQGLYGAGRVKIFDKGNYQLIEKSKNKIIFYLQGEKIQGKFVLLKLSCPQQWLIEKIE